MTEPFAGWAGPRQPKIVAVAEAWGENEAQLHQPLVGESGKEFWRMLGQAAPHIAPELHAEITAKHRYGLAWVRDRHQWMTEASISFTNVFNLRPQGNQIESLCTSKKELPSDYPPQLPPIARAHYLRPEYLSEVTRLYRELATARPNLVLALGNTACWALLRLTAIGSIRGTTCETIPIETGPSAGDSGAPAGGFRLKCLPTYHPAGVLRQWSWRPIVCLDLAKAFREAEFPEIRRPSRRITVSPTLGEAEAWVGRTLARPPRWLACDIETGQGQIKCIGFARSRDDALVIPFVDLGRPGGSYWPDHASEYWAWTLVRRLLESPIPKLFQNGVYDLQYILKMGIRPQAVDEDTMLLHHSLWPEMQKGLGFLGSIYTSEPSWKLMVRRRQVDKSTEKRDE